MTAPAKASQKAIWAIVDSPELTDAEVRLWLWYRRHHVDDRGAYVSAETTAEALDWSVRKVERVRCHLVAHDLLELVGGGPRPPRYYPLAPTPVTAQAPTRMAEQAPSAASVQSTDKDGDAPTEAPTNLSPAIKEAEPGRNRDTPSPPPPPSGVVRKHRWLKPYWDAWIARYRGKPNGGQLAKALCKLHEEHGVDAVLSRWEAYLAKTPAAYANPHRFAATFGSSEWESSEDVLSSLCVRDEEVFRAKYT